MLLALFAAPFRHLRLHLFAKNIVRPLGMLIMGLLLQLLGPVSTLLISTGGSLLVALLMTSNRHIRTARREQV